MPATPDSCISSSLSISPDAGVGYDHMNDPGRNVAATRGSSPYIERVGTGFGIEYPKLTCELTTKGG